MENTIPFVEINHLLNCIKDTENLIKTLSNAGETTENLQIKQYVFLKKKYINNLNNLLQEIPLPLAMVDISV